MFVTLSNAGLATLFRMRRCRTPKHVGRGIPVYDSAFWHIIVPETIRHLPPATPSTSRRLPPDRDNRNPTQPSQPTPSGQRTAVFRK